MGSGWGISRRPTPPRKHAEKCMRISSNEQIGRTLTKEAIQNGVACQLKSSGLGRGQVGRGTTRLSTTLLG